MILDKSQTAGQIRVVLDGAQTGERSWNVSAAVQIVSVQVPHES